MSQLTPYQLRIYGMKLEGLDGVEWIGRELRSRAGKKFIQETSEGAIKNLVAGKRWDS